MNYKTKLVIIKLIDLENKILDIYKTMAKKEIYNEDITNEINIIKELITEEEFINELSYKEIKEILNCIQNLDDLNYMLIQRISNLLNIKIDKLHLIERLEELEEDIDEQYIEYTRKEDVVVEYLMRDLVLLKIKKINDRIKNNDNKDIRNRLINYKFLYLYSNVSVEEEMINNKFNLDTLHLLNKMAIQLSLLEKEIIDDIYKEISEQYILTGSIQKLLNINNIIISEGKNKENSKLIDTEIIINTAFLEAELEIFSINKETIIEIINNKLKGKSYFILNDIKNKINCSKKDNTSYLTLIRKK